MINQRFRTPVITLRYAWLNKPNTKFNADGVYECAALFNSPEDQARFLEVMGNQFEKWRTSQTFSAKEKALWDGFSIDQLIKSVPGWNEGDDELEAIRFKSKYAPKIFDSNGGQFTDPVYSGTTARIEFKANPAIVTGRAHLTMYVNQVQIIEAAEGSAEVFDMGGDDTSNSDEGIDI